MLSIGSLSSIDDGDGEIDLQSLLNLNLVHDLAK